jgi:arylsulfatase
MYSTDNGPENDTWPDAANTPFRSQKDTNWEGAWRVPAFIRWPGQIKPGTVLNGIVTHQDMLPTLLAAAGDPDVKDKLLKGYQVGDQNFKVHIDGFNMIPYFTGQVKDSPRESFFYFSDDGDIMSIRVGDVKLTFALQESVSSNVWADPLKKLRVPHIFHLRRDPFERADFNSQVYWKWVMHHAPYLYLCQAVVAAQVEEFVKYPPRQKAASFNLDTVMASLAPAEAAYKKQQAEAAAATGAAKAAPAKAKDSQRELAPAD